MTVVAFTELTGEPRGGHILYSTSLEQSLHQNQTQCQKFVNSPKKYQLNTYRLKKLKAY